MERTKAARRHRSLEWRRKDRMRREKKRIFRARMRTVLKPSARFAHTDRARSFNRDRDKTRGTIYI